MDNMEEIARCAGACTEYLCEKGKLAPGSLIVLGCSTSEVCGGTIGKSSSPETGTAIVRAVRETAAAHGLWLAVQCCEHLNRALVVEAEYAVRHDLPRVCAVPHPHAGGSAAAAAYRLFDEPVVVEEVKAQAGLDIGDTLIGMHLMPVAVPLRGPFSRIGSAHLTMAFTRPKYIGGPRTRYTVDPD